MLKYRKYIIVFGLLTLALLVLSVVVFILNHRIPLFLSLASFLMAVVFIVGVRWLKEKEKTEFNKRLKKDFEDNTKKYEERYANK